MLKIRTEQMEAFDNKFLRDFEDEMWVHCQEFAPQMCKVAKEDNVRLAIQQGIENASNYGFTNRGPVRFYIELMFTFGQEFDTDPQHRGWTSTLRQKDASQTVRADRLYDAYSQFANATIGESHQILIRALKRIVAMSEDDLSDFDEKGIDGISELFKVLYPERYFAIGREAADQTIESAITTATNLGASSHASNVVSFGLTLLIGHKHGADSLYPWVTQAFASELDADGRFFLAFRKAKVYLRRVIDYLEGA